MKQNAYIVAGYRSAVGKAGKGGFRFYRPDDLAADVIKHLMASVPQLDKDRVDDVIVGNATPEAEQGLNMARLISLMGLNTDKVPGMTVNRYCASGLETIAIATAKIEAGNGELYHCRRSRIHVCHGDGRMENRSQFKSRQRKSNMVLGNGFDSGSRC